MEDISSEALIADKGYDADWLLTKAAAQGIKEVVILPESSRKVQRAYNKELYRERNRIERFFKRLKHYRRIATRYERPPETSFLSFSWLQLSATTNCQQYLVYTSAVLWTFIRCAL